MKQLYATLIYLSTNNKCALALFRLQCFAKMCKPCLINYILDRVFNSIVHALIVLLLPLSLPYRLRIKPQVVLKSLSIGVVSTDQSYMPELVTVAVGTSVATLREISEVKVDR